MPTTQLTPAALPGRRYATASFSRPIGVPEGVLEARGPIHVPPPLRPFIPVTHRGKPMLFSLEPRLRMRLGRARTLATAKGLSPVGGARLIVPRGTTANVLPVYATVPHPNFRCSRLIVTGQPINLSVTVPSAVPVKGRLLMGGRRQALVSAYYELLGV